MKSRLPLLAVFALITALLAFRIKEIRTVNHPSSFSPEYKKKVIARCGPDWELLKEWLAETDIPPIPGAGNYKWKISTEDDSAQFYFNQGINMYYSFHIIEAMASFKKAVRFDPRCAMLYWAQALGYGPNINDLGYRASPEALAAVKKAQELASNSTSVEKQLINAIAVRYTSDSTDMTRSKLNSEYTAMMKKVYQNHPSHPDVQALYVDAMMLEHPWDLWYNNGTPKPWTPLIRELLEKLLTKNPEHPGANHYYIHVMEPSPFAAKALPSANRLGTLTPGLSHTVHMPSHIYLRTGNYQKAVDVNIAAVISYKKTIPLYAPVINADFLYIIHNLHMKTNNAMLAGQSATSVAAAFETVNSIPKDYLSIPGPMGNVVQYISMTPTLVFIRFGKWYDLLQLSQPDLSLVYSNVLYRFGRGMALANQSRFAEATEELNQMKELMKDSTLALPFTPFSSAMEGAIVAENLLTGTIALKQKRTDDAIAAFTKAVIAEENMVYNEPRDWLLNPKHYLGNAYLENVDGKNAEKVFRKDLMNNNDNGWALLGLQKSMLLQNKNTEAAKILSRYKKAFDKADIKITSPVY
ncbi:MAG: hypothetical protein ABL876_04430 [Chitinophagaceae bacterium]